MPEKVDTPLLDELEKGPWPSFVSEIKSAASWNEGSKDLLGVLERSYRERIGHWKHGGIVGVLGYGGGIIGRYSDVPEDFPGISHFHTIRINQPAGWYYTSEKLRALCDIWEKRGSGLTNMHGSTGDIIFLGTTTDQLEPIFKDLTDLGFDIGGSGSDVRTPSCCLGQSRCEWACYDTMKVTHNLTMDFQDELHRPAFPYKFKFKMSGCPNDCVAAVARADCSIIGTWKDEIQMDQAEVKAYVDGGLDIQNDVIRNCPAQCMDWNGTELAIDNSACRRCMHCINVMPKALRPGKERGATILMGSKAPIVEGALLSSVMIPFIDIEEDYEDFKGLIEDIWDLWCEEGMARERVGEFIQRIGLGNFLDAVGLDPVPEMVSHPRENPYVFYDLSEGDDDEDEDDDA